VPAIAVPAFALTWWLACYLVGRNPARPAGRRAAGALLAYALGVAVWTVAPGSTAAEVLLTMPALLWAGAAVALLPDFVPERRQIERGWLVVSAAFVLITVLLPAAGRLVVLVPLIGGLSLLWRFRDQVEPRMLPVALTVVAVLYGAALVVLLFPADLGAPGLSIAAIGVDLLILGYLVAVAEAVDAGERLRPDLSRSLVAAVLGTLLAGGPAILTMFAAEGEPVAILQFVLVGVVMTVVGLSGPVHRVLDRAAFWSDERLRGDRAALLLLADALPRHRERHRLIVTSETEFLRFVRHALESYGDLGRLMRNPLTDLPAVDQRLSGRAIEQPLARALELRTVLQEAVSRMRPSGPFGTDEQWRHYNALYFGYVLGLQPYRRRLRTDGLDRDTRRVVEWLRGYVPRHLLRRWKSEGAALVATRLWDDMVSTDPRWLTRVPAGKRATTTTRST
jgi:hypothetical protein